MSHDMTAGKLASLMASRPVFTLGELTDIVTSARKTRKFDLVNQNI